MTFMENEFAVDTAQENTNIVEDTSTVSQNDSEMSDDVTELSTNQDEDISSNESDGEGERAEYERLIRTKFKGFYSEDTQKMINKRFKKYKALEEKIRDMEESAKRSEARIAELDALVISERERIERETEERITARIMANRARACENAMSDRREDGGFDVSKLTRGERAALADRALRGEKIAF